MANRFWVGGTGTWDNSDTTHWALASGAGGGQSAPGAGDAVTFDGASGGGTVTVNATIGIQSLTCGAFTGTLDFSANNNNVTVTAASGVSISGTGTRTINLGNGTWSFTTAASVNWTAATTTGLTFNANSSNLVFSGAGAKTFAGGGLTYATVTVNPFTAGASMTFTGSATFTNFVANGPCNIFFPAATTQNITNGFTWTGTPTGPVYISSSTDATAGTISCANTCRLNWCALRRMTYSGGGTFSAVNSFDLGGNTGPTIVPPRGPRPSFRLGI